MTKYGNRRVQVDNIWFDSQKEANRYMELKLLLKAGEIHTLVMHPSYQIWVNNLYICSYVADFSYVEGSHNIVEDCKGVRTAVYRLKKTLMAAVLGIDILET